MNLWIVDVFVVVVTIFAGVELVKVRVSFYIFYILIVYVCYFLIVFFILEVYSFVLKRVGKGFLKLINNFE